MLCIELNSALQNITTAAMALLGIVLWFLFSFLYILQFYLCCILFYYLYIGNMLRFDAVMVSVDVEKEIKD